MKTSITAVLTLTIVIVITGIISCNKKDKLEDPKKAIAGYWKGKYGPSSPPLLDWELLFKPDGTLRVYDGSDTATAGKGEGTYSISDSVVTTHFAFFSDPGYTFSSAGILNANSTKITGTYGRSDPSGGFFFLDKQ
jgi:hypothetical protein